MGIKLEFVVWFCLTNYHDTTSKWSVIHVLSLKLG